MTQQTASSRMELALPSVAVAFFDGIIFAPCFGPLNIGIGVLRFAIVGFLSVAIGRMPK